MSYLPREAIFTKFADVTTVGLFKMSLETRLGSAVHFFIEDVSKIFVLIIVMIYLIALVRASMNTEQVRDHLAGKPKWFGYGAASIFGAITPFCSCSSIPLFLGFTSAGIPTGVTLSFLVTSPLINEVAVVLLGTLLGWKFTIIYVTAGLGAGIIAGFFFDAIGADKWLQPLATKVETDGSVLHIHSENTKMTMKERHKFAKEEAISIFKKIWLWVIVGVGIGSGLHGFVPDNWIAEHLGTGAIWSVPVAVLMGIPLYSNATGMIPIIETLLAKGLPVGTALAFMMATVGASIPEFIMLKQVLKPRLLVILFFYFLVTFTLMGWLINAVF